MTNVQLAIKNFDAQEQIFDALYKYRFVIVAKGRRFGLTKGAANNFIKRAAARTFTKGLWVDVINGNIDKYVQRYFLPKLRALPQDKWAWKKQEKTLYMFDSYIDFRSADKPESLEGFGYDLAFLNEAGIILKNEYLWHNAIKPMLWDHKAPTLIGGAPKGKGLFYELALRGQDPNQTRYKFFSFSSFDNPYLDHEELHEEIKDTPENVVKQEVFAEFLDDSGVVFRGTSQVMTATIQEPIKGHLYVIGTDIAKVQDFTVLAVYDRATNKQVFQMRFNQLEWPYQRQRIKEVSKKYNNALVILDATGVGNPTYDDLVREGVAVEAVTLTNEVKKNIIQKLANWIELKHIRMLYDIYTLTEFNSFTYDISEKTGRWIYNAPAGFHDDIVIAHALAVWSLQPIIQEEVPEELTIIQKDYRAKLEAFRGDTDDYEII
jgi:hypothetical protein